MPLVVAAAGSLACLNPQPAAAADAPAVAGDAAASETIHFVERFAAEAIAILRDGSLTAAERDESFRAMLLNGFDTDAGARFALGRGWRTATAQQRDEYVALFREEMLRLGKHLFEDYEGEVLDVRRIVPLKADSFLVVTKLSNPEARINDIDFVVRRRANGFQILDVQFEGISLLDSYRSEFVGLLFRGGVEGVLRVLRRRSES